MLRRSPVVPVIRCFALVGGVECLRASHAAVVILITATAAAAGHAGVGVRRRDARRLVRVGVGRRGRRRVLVEER